MKQNDLPDPSDIGPYLKKSRALLDQLIVDATPAQQVVAWWTAVIDRLLIDLFKRAGEDFSSLAIAAQGGYGRQELCYHSDIDLLFLYSGSKTKSFEDKIKKVLYPLWDHGFDIGVAVRTVGECIRMSKEDVTILSSLMDTRFLAGNRSLFEKFERDFWKCFKSKRFKNAFLERKAAENKERSDKYGTSIYLLEPNLKEGKGGLRDYHYLHWVTQAVLGTKWLETMIAADVLTAEELKTLKEALAFLWSVRNQLHRVAGRRSDQLLLEFQEKVAQAMGFQDSEKILATEDFLRTYYRHTAECSKITAKGIQKLTKAKRETFRLFSGPAPKKIDSYFHSDQGKLALLKPTLFEEEPDYLLKVFLLMQQEGIEFDQKIRDKITENLGRIDEAFQENPEMGALFRQLFSQPATLLPVLQAMHELRVLDRFLPEFHNLMFRAQHDVYHLYTVDAHSIFAVGEFGKLIRGDYQENYPTPTAVAQNIKRKELLAFAILYHDIGKGEGSGHVKKGAPLIREAGLRLGFSEADVDALEFLELSHLMMTHLAFRRDLDDPSLIRHFARAMQNEELLEYLYVLTFCDVNAVSPDALTDWKETLLEYLFLKAHALLSKGDFTKKRIEEVRNKLHGEVRLLAKDELTDESIDSFFQEMPPRYFLTAEAVTILDHIQMRQGLQKDPIVIRHRNLEKEKLSAWTLYGPNSPELFSKICGVMAANSMNIFEAQLNETKTGEMLVILKVLTAQGKILEDKKKWEQIASDLRDVLTSKQRVENLVTEKLRPSFFKPKQARKFPGKVQIDNDLSPFYTVIDVYAHDRIGLLYQITSKLNELGVYVDISKIATKVDQVSDVFYIRDIFKHKITSKEKLEKIRSALFEVIE